MVLPAPHRGPRILVGGRPFRFAGAIDRTYGPADVIYVADGPGPAAVVREGVLVRVVGDAARALAGANVLRVGEGRLAFTSAATGRWVSRPVAAVTDGEWGAMEVWVRDADRGLPGPRRPPGMDSRTSHGPSSGAGGHSDPAKPASQAGCPFDEAASYIEELRGPEGATPPPSPSLPTRSTGISAARSSRSSSVRHPPSGVIRT